MSGRRGSAVEQLALEDRRASLGSVANDDARLTTLQSRGTGGRATDGHEPQLSRVSEDVSPLSHPTDPTAPTFAPIIEEGNGSVPPQKDGMQDYFFNVNAPEASVCQGQLPLPSPQARPPGSVTTPSTRPASTTPPVSGPRFLTPFAERSSPARPSTLTSETAPSSTPDNDASGARGNRLRRARSNVSIPTPVLEESRSRDTYDEENHTDDVADYLDVVDPEVGALGYLSNIGNSIFLPNIPALYDRRPTHNLPTNRKRGQSFSSLLSARRGSAASARSGRSHTSGGALEEGRVESPNMGFTGGVKPMRTGSKSMLTRVSSAVGWGRKDKDEEAEYAHHIKKWREMDEEERDELDDHVRMLLTKKSKFKRGLKGFYAFVKTPMGFIMTLYGLLITFWGTAIVLFIFGWIRVGDRRRYWIEICDQILCALFAAVGLGFAPFRAVDTYRMIHIAHYHHLTWKRRKALGLTELNDPNDLPRPEQDGSNQVSRADEGERDSPTQDGVETPHTYVVEGSNHSLLSHGSSHSHNSSNKRSKSSGHKFNKKVVLPSQVQEKAEETDPTGKTGDLSRGKESGTGGSTAPPLKRNESIQSELVKEREDVVVLTKGEQQVLEHHQRKFHASHTFYRFHETATHRAFPLDLMIVIVCLLDCHSLLQAALGGCTWGIKYTHRPTALTATLISCSLSCNAVAGLIIYLGGRRTKKREEVERRLKIALEQEALEKIERRRARGELPERNRGDRTSEEEEEAEQEASDRRRDQLAKGLGQADDSSGEARTSMEMSPVKPPAGVDGSARTDA